MADIQISQNARRQRNDQPHKSKWRPTKPILHDKKKGRCSTKKN
ncbi:hypothetical protein [Hymenobacter qilianensis]|nr:hypothetical protein [Hymenobacter qilianensis]